MSVTALVLLALLAPPSRPALPGRPPRPRASHGEDREAARRRLGMRVSACPEESISFEIREIARPFASYLHDRPAIVGGSWQPRRGPHHGPARRTPCSTWDIVTLTSVRLEVKGDGDKANAVFRRSMR